MPPLSGGRGRVSGNGAVRQCRGSPARTTGRTQRRRRGAGSRRPAILCTSGTGPLLRGARRTAPALRRFSHTAHDSVSRQPTPAAVVTTAAVCAGIPRQQRLRPHGLSSGGNGVPSGGRGTVALHGSAVIGGVRTGNGTAAARWPADRSNERPPDHRRLSQGGRG